MSPLQLYIQEESTESLARQLLLLSTFTDSTLSPLDRLETFLDIHHNLLIQHRTQAHVTSTCQRLTKALESHSPAKFSGCPFPYTIDASLLKHKSLDEILSHLHFIAQAPTPSSPTPSFDAVALREARLRHYYGDRYDSRMNVIDWDYHFRLKAVHSLSHVYHVRRWRMSGQAYEKRECQYEVSNRSMASYREGKVRGRGAVQVRGYWGDVVVGPFMVWGSDSLSDDWYEVRQDQHVKHAVDLTEENVRELMGRTGEGAAGVTVHLVQGGLGEMGGGKWQGRFHRAWMSHARCGHLGAVSEMMRAGGWLTLDTLWAWPVTEGEKQAAVTKLREMGEKAGWEWEGGRKEIARDGRGGSEGKDRTAHGVKYVSFVWKGRKMGEKAEEAKEQVSG